VFTVGVAPFFLRGLGSRVDFMAGGSSRFSSTASILDHYRNAGRESKYWERVSCRVGLSSLFKVVSTLLEFIS
jgi:hypothetical protein